MRVEFKDGTHATTHGEVDPAFDLVPLISIVPVHRSIRINNGKGEIEQSSRLVPGSVSRRTVVWMNPARVIIKFGLVWIREVLVRRAGVH